MARAAGIDQPKRASDHERWKPRQLFARAEMPAAKDVAGEPTAASDGAIRCLAGAGASGFLSGGQQILKTMVLAA
jgi:hypothetical protein